MVGIGNDRIVAYLTVHKLSSIKRTGWVDYHVTNPETIMCHMYDTWLLGKIFLPETLANPEYDKNKILDMILIHDIAESITGDIITPVKELDPKYDADESRAMKHILDLVPNDTLKSTWIEWADHVSINSIIAKDLDILQSIVQYCLYRPMTPALQTNESTNNWLGKKNRLKSPICIDIYDDIVPLLMTQPDLDLLGGVKHGE